MKIVMELEQFRNVLITGDVVVFTELKKYVRAYHSHDDTLCVYARRICVSPSVVRCVYRFH